MQREPPAENLITLGDSPAGVEDDSLAFFQSRGEPHPYGIAFGNGHLTKIDFAFCSHHSDQIFVILDQQRSRRNFNRRLHLEKKGHLDKAARQ